MAYKYKASVIIPTYNREKLLEMTLITLMKQNVSKEIIIDKAKLQKYRDSSC